MEEKILIKSESKKAMITMVKMTPLIIGIALLPSGSILEQTFLSDFGYFGGPVLGVAIIILTIAFIFKCKNLKQGIYVTEKRVYGTTVFGKRVDIPLDSISAVSLTNLFSGVSVASSSGRISFSFLENQDEIFKTISELIRDRQDAGNSTPKEEKHAATEEIKKLKELLDMGAITQEEYDAKKKELLGL